MKKNLTCLYCACNLDSHQYKYCSLSHQRSHQRQTLTEKWLSTGVASNNTSHNQNYIRVYISEKQQHRCSICGIEDEWCGKPLTFILDHIDGNSTNMQESNLRLVCSNCDSQLPTYKSKNRGSGRHYRRQRYREDKSF